MASSTTLAEVLPHNGAREQCASVEFKRVGGEFALDDLWFFTGSVCNLRCIHCYVGSSPRNTTYEFLTPEDVRPVLEEAGRFAVREVYFTGGEPFANPSFMEILSFTLDAYPVTVLTNGTGPLAAALPQVEGLANAHPRRMAIRVSFDHYDETRHNAIRHSGNGAADNNFAKSVESVVRLSQLGITPIITYSAEVFRGNPVPQTYVERRTREMFRERGAQVEVKFLSALIDQGAQKLRRDVAKPAPVLTERYLQAIRADKRALMCHSSRMIAKRGGALHVYPCPVLVGSDAAAAEALAPYDLGSSLAESFSPGVNLTHPSCATYCCLGKSTCANNR